MENHGFLVKGVAGWCLLIGIGILFYQYSLEASFDGLTLSGILLILAGFSVIKGPKVAVDWRCVDCGSDKVGLKAKKKKG